MSVHRTWEFGPFWTKKKNSQKDTQTDRHSDGNTHRRHRSNSSLDYVTCQSFSLFYATRLKNGTSIWKKYHIFMKKGTKSGLCKLLNPFWGFKLNTVPGSHDPRIPWLPFGTKDHEMRGFPVKRISTHCLDFALSKLSAFNFRQVFLFVQSKTTAD